MSSTEDWLSEILVSLVCEALMDDYNKTVSNDDSGLIKLEDEAKAKIRQHMLSEALVLIGEDDNEVRGTTQSPDNPNYWTKRTKHRNELKAELRQAFTEKYGERE